MPRQPTRTKVAPRDNTTPERAIVAVDPITPDAAFETPVAKHDDDSVVESLLAGLYETPVQVDLPENEATATVGQRDALQNMGCPIEEIDMATTYDAIDDLFDKYGNRPSPGQMEFLRKRGVPNLALVTTRELAGKVLCGYGPFFMSSSNY